MTVWPSLDLCSACSLVTLLVYTDQICAAEPAVARNLVTINVVLVSSHPGRGRRHRCALDVSATSGDVPHLSPSILYTD